MAEVMDMPVRSEKSEYLAKAYGKLNERGYFNNDFRNIRLLGLWGVSASDYLIQTTKKPVLSVDDFKGKKIRATGSLQSKIASLLGAEPVGMTAPELYLALDRGVVDGYFGAYSLLSMIKGEGLVKHATPLPITGVSCGLVMNKSFYEGLPKDVQGLLDEMTKDNKMGARIIMDNYRLFDIGRKAFLAKGGEEHQLPESEMDRVGTAIGPVWENWIKDGQGKGLDRKKMLNDLGGILKDIGVQKPFLGYTPS